MTNFLQITIFGMILTPIPQFILCGLTQKEKEARIESFSFSYLLLSLLNNLLWLAYGHKIGDENIGIPAMIGKSIDQFLLIHSCFQVLSSVSTWYSSTSLSEVRGIKSLPVLSWYQSLKYSSAVLSRPFWQAAPRHSYRSQPISPLLAKSHS